MTPQLENLLAEITRIIVQTVDPERIVLFGSQARDEATEASDVDLIVVEREPFGPLRSRRAEAARITLACRNVPVAKDVLLFSEGEFESWKGSRNHPVGRAMREGRVLYARP